MISLTKRNPAAYFSGILLVLTVITAVGMSGCEPLRKKFTRQKAKATQESTVVPVLEPVDYPAQSQTSQERYRYHYSLWNVWNKELISALDEQGSDKQILHDLDQMSIQLEQMGQLLQGEKKEQLGGYKAKLIPVKEQFDQPAAMRDNLLIKSKVIRIDREFRQNFKFDKIKESIVP